MQKLTNGLLTFRCRVPPLRHSNSKCVGPTLWMGCEIVQKKKMCWKTFRNHFGCNIQDFQDVASPPVRSTSHPSPLLQHRLWIICWGSNTGEHWQGIIMIWFVDQAGDYNDRILPLNYGCPIDFDCSIKRWTGPLCGSERRQKTCLFSYIRYSHPQWHHSPILPPSPPRGCFLETLDVV